MLVKKVSIKGYPYQSGKKTYSKAQIENPSIILELLKDKDKNLILLDNEALKSILFLNQLLFDAFKNVKEFKDWMNKRISTSQFDGIKALAKAFRDGGFLNG